MRHVIIITTIIVLISGCTGKEVKKQNNNEATPVPAADGNPPKIGAVRPLDESAKPSAPIPTPPQRPVKIENLSDTQPPGEPAAPPGSRKYNIQKNDTYWSIAAKQLGDGKRWKEIDKLNPKVDRNDLKIGQVILIPAK